MPVRLRVRLCPRVGAEAAAAAAAEKGASMRVVGDTPELGQWDPKRSPKLACTGTDPDGATMWEGELDDKAAPPGKEFKYCVLVQSKHMYCWESAGPMHRMPSPEDTTPLHHFNDGNSDGQGGGGAAGVAFTGAMGSPAAGAKGHVAAVEPPAAEEVLKGDESGLSDCWIPWAGGRCAGGSGPSKPAAGGSGAKAPRSIFHAFHWPFSEVRKHLKTIHDGGFDAVQISPAQKSTGGKEWWTRYQPKDYTTIEGLGSADDLRGLCTDAAALGVMIIADVVFNHMIVVAGAHDWERAQKAGGSKLQGLKKRLSEAVGPHLDAEDFQWPWFKMEGEHWDNDNRYEGWGNGEWSELKHCKKVVDVHNRHLKDLLDAGVRGIRFDAIKHMRPAHIDDYLRFLRQQPFDVYTYGEVLSVDDTMQKEYMDPLSMPTTDFGLTVYMNKVVQSSSGPSDAAAGAGQAALAAAAADGVAISGGASGGAGAQPASVTKADGARAELSAPSPPSLAADSVRFARNHDTVNNPGSFYGLSGSCKGTRVVWAWLLAVHDGTVLMYPEDAMHAESSSLISKAMKFRSGVGSRAASSEVCIHYLPPKKGSAAAKKTSTEPQGRPALVAVTLRDGEGSVLGLCLLNLLRESKLRVASVPMRQGSMAAAAELSTEDGAAVSLRADGGFRAQKKPGDDGAASVGDDGSLVIPPWDAIFLSKAS